MNTNHTPGPWKVEKYITRREFVTDTKTTSADGSYLAKVGPCNIEANAQLIAAAPELLAALETVSAFLTDMLLVEGRPDLGTLSDHVWDSDGIKSIGDIVSAAIAKAQGEG